MAYTLPALAYSFDALEPFIDAKTMEIHYTKHHQGYVNNLNAALEKEPTVTSDLETLLKDLESLPESIRGAVRNNGGGHFNHSFFWPQLKVNHQESPQGKLSNALNETFGSYDAFKESFAKAAATRFGSGWAWLIKNNQGALEVVSTPNQDTPLTLGTPLLALDVWEHAYYLNYQNRRPDYIQAFFSIVDWDLIEERFNKA
jgi:superoxide dismutase, Fe-Mn family